MAGHTAAGGIGSGGSGPDQRPAQAGVGGRYAPALPVGAGGNASTTGGGVGGSSVAGAGASGAGALDRVDRGKGDGRDVVTIGDSYMQLSAGTAVEPALERAADNAYRNYAQQGTRLIGGTNPIPGQYARAVAEDPKIVTVVMTGGGNDILQEAMLRPECSQMTPSQRCLDALPPLLDALATLWDKMSKDGVQDVFFLTYPRAPAGATLAGGLRNLAPVLNPMLQSKCDAVPSPLRCHLLIGDDAFKTTPFELRTDGIHPTDAGYAVLGEFVFDAMVAAGARR
jgi:lysophospholipase L1-like esterase